MESGKLSVEGAVGKGRQVQWLSLLVVGVFLLAAGLIAANWNPTVFGGRQTPADHVKAQRKQEIDLRFNEGVLMLHAKQYEHAYTAFHRVLQLAPEMPEAYVNAGFAMLGMGKPKEAADFFESATMLRPNQMNAYYGLGTALMELGNKHGALQAMEAFMHRSKPDDPFRRKAESAIWELRAELGKTQPPENMEAAPHRRREGK